MVIKDKFKLINNVDNVLKIRKNTLESYQIEENSPRHVFTFLSLKQRSINHFAKSKVFKFISDKKLRQSLQVVNFDKYPLSASYNIPTKGMIINLKSLDVEEVANLSPNDLYASILYTYAFSRLVTGQVNIQEIYAQPIVNFLTSMFVRVFGKDYGLTETYASSIPKMKFLLACYIYTSFFGQAVNDNLLRKAMSIAPYNYQDEADKILKYDYSDITQFLKALSDLKVMPGIKVYSFTTKIFRFFKIDMIAGLEDLSRFLCVILVSSVTGSSIVPSFISKYNEREYKNLIELTRKVIR
jgi:hypothetical protein